MELIIHVVGVINERSVLTCGCGGPGGVGGGWGGRRPGLAEVCYYI